MELKEALIEIYKNLKERLGIEKDPKLILKNDEENSKNIFGRTAYYAPNSETVVVYVTNRHPKDICRSFAHELVHHHQNERGDLNLGDASSPNYAQEDGHMRKMEMEAYLKGNMMFRDFEDNYKKQIREYTGTGAGGGNATDGNDITSPRPFADDEDERENYMNKNVYGGSGRHYKHEPATTGYNRTKFTKFEEGMKKSDVYKIIEESIKEVLQERGADAYGDATNLTKGLNVAKSRFTKTGRPPGVLDEEDALVTRGKLILQVLNEPENKEKKKTFDDFIKRRTNGKFGLPNKINDKTDGDILALMSLRAKDFGDVFRKAKYFNEAINLDIQDDIAILSGDSGKYEGEIEDGKVSFSVIYDDLDTRITDQYDESNIEEFLGKNHAFVELSKKYNHTWDIEPDLVGITIKLT